MNEYLIQETKEYIKNIFNNNYDDMIIIIQ